MQSCKLPVIKEKLRELGLPVTGSKAELLIRLTNAGITDLGHSDSRQDTSPEDEENETEASVLENIVSQDARCSAITGASDPMELRFLRREKELADREIELLRRELQLARNSPRSEVSERHRETLDWRNVKDMIADFNGSNDRDYDAWEKQIKRLVLDYQIDGHAAKAMLCSKLKDKALRWYHSRPDNVDLNFEEVLSEMRKMFYQRQNKLQLRREFDMRTWQKSESFADYMHEKVMLANQVLTDRSEIVDYVIDGIPDANLRAQAHIQNFETPAKLLERFSKISLQEDTVTSRTGPSHHGTVAAPHKKVKEHRKPPRDSDQSLIRCYNCNELGHFASDCKRPKRERGSCYRCGEQGHRSGQCTRKEDVNWVVQPPEDDVHRTLEFRFREKSQNYSVNVHSLIDSGSPISFIKEACVPSEFRDVVSSRDPPFYGVNGSKLEIIGVSKVKVVVDGDEIDLNIYVVSNSTMSVFAVLGRDFLKAANFELFRNTGVHEIMSINVECTQVEPISQQVIENKDLPEYIKCEKNNVQHIKVATASPQANGQVERLNRSIVPMIAKPASERKEPRHKFLPDVEYACNNTVCRPTGESPSVLLFGVHQRGEAVDGIREGLEANNIVRPSRNLISRRENANKQIKRIQGYNEVNYNKKRKAARKYAEGDHVMIRNCVNTAGVSTKLVPKFKGPYKVIKVLRNDRYVVADIDGFQMTQTPYQGTWEAVNMQPWSSVIYPSSR